MATISKTSEGTWRVQVRMKGWPPIGRTFRTKRDAEDWGRRTEDEMVRGVFIQRAPSERMTVSSAIERYLAEVSPHKRPTTHQTELLRAKFLDAYFGAYSLAAVTPDLVGKYRDGRLAGSLKLGGKGAPLSASSVRIELALLSHIFTTAMREWNIGLSFNPVKSTRKPTPAPGRNRRLNPEEERRLLAAADAHSNPMLGWIVRIGLETGMRSSEITTLRIRQVDLDGASVHIEETKNTVPRYVPLSIEAKRVFKMALSHATRPKGSDLIFFGEPGRDGKRRPYVFNPAWAIVKRKADVGDLHFHDLRHEAVSRWVEMDFSDQKVAAMSGHLSMQMMKRYTHLRTKDLATELNERKKQLALRSASPSKPDDPPTS